MNIRKTWSVTLAALVFLVACGGAGQRDNRPTKRDAVDTVGKDMASTFLSAPSPGRRARGEAIGRIRVMNAITVNGAPGPAMDVYDISRPDANTKPLITGLQYGQVSDYVTPHGWAPGDTTSNLYLFPAGSREPTGLLTGSNIDHSGFTAGDQITLPLFATQLGFGDSPIVEGGSRLPRGSDVAAPAGQGLLMVREAVSRVDDAPQPVMYLSIDGSCPNVGGGAEGHYPIAPGDHTIALVTSPPGRGLTQARCAEQSPVASIHARVEAGQRLDVIVYGAPQALKLLAAPVAN